MKRSAYHFFLSHAGYAYDPKTQTPLQGRRECAKNLAYHEKRARDAGCSFVWEVDPEINSSDFSDDPNPWQLWQVVARDAEGHVFASLGGVDFGRDRDPWMDPYRRVVEAELACELPYAEDAQDEAEEQERNYNRMIGESLRRY